ncbi:hypothetical protein ACFYMW_25210 [Streptomyces sp. NPDC006692]|uniref:hypothetical protein n=1 Tax=unclassified Streptomyces TaxID=2593676 RepID=UPI0036811A9A
MQQLLDDGFATHDDIPRITSRPIHGRQFPRHSAQDSHIRFDHAMRTLALMHDAGVKITAGSDVAILMPLPPVALLRELQLLAKAGLPLPAVLAAGTRHSAEKIGQQATTPAPSPSAPLPTHCYSTPTPARTSRTWSIVPTTSGRCALDGQAGIRATPNPDTADSSSDTPAAWSPRFWAARSETPRALGIEKHLIDLGKPAAPRP